MLSFQELEIILRDIDIPEPLWAAWSLSPEIRQMQTRILCQHRLGNERSSAQWHLQQTLGFWLLLYTVLLFSYLQLTRTPLINLKKWKPYGWENFRWDLLLQLNQKVKSIEGMRRNIYWITYNLQQVLKKYNYWASYGDQGFFSDALHTETLFNLHLLRSTLQPLVQGTGKKTWKDKRDKENKVTKKKRMKADTFLYHSLTTLA